MEFSEVSSSARSGRRPSTEGEAAIAEVEERNVNSL